MIFPQDWSGVFQQLVNAQKQVADLQVQLRDAHEKQCWTQRQWDGAVDAFVGVCNQRDELQKEAKMWEDCSAEYAKLLREVRGARDESKKHSSESRLAEVEASVKKLEARTSWLARWFNVISKMAPIMEWPNE